MYFFIVTNPDLNKVTILLIIYLKLIINISISMKCHLFKNQIKRMFLSKSSKTCDMTMKEDAIEVKQWSWDGIGRGLRLLIPQLDCCL